MKTNELVRKLGEAIRKKREKLGISRDDLARQIGKTVIQVEDVEENFRCTDTTIFYLLSALKLTVICIDECVLDTTSDAVDKSDLLSGYKHYGLPDARIVYALVDGKIVTFSSDNCTFKFSPLDAYKGFLWVESETRKYTFMPGDWEYDRKILEDRLRDALLNEIAHYAEMITKLVKMREQE